MFRLVLSARFTKSIIPLSFHFRIVLLQFAAMNNVFTMILAGGKGERLSPLTEQRAKPAVPFGGKYRIVDFAYVDDAGELHAPAPLQGPDADRTFGLVYGCAIFELVKL